MYRLHQSRKTAGGTASPVSPPTKAFNIAGIQTSAVIVPNETIRHKVNRGLNTDEVAEPNVFAAIAPVAAFMHGGEWLDELNEYLWENRKRAEEYIDHEIENVDCGPGRSDLSAVDRLPGSDRRF